MMDVLCKYLPALKVLTSIRVFDSNDLHSLTDLMEMIHEFSVRVWAMCGVNVARKHWREAFHDDVIVVMRYRLKAFPSNSIVRMFQSKLVLRFDLKRSLTQNRLICFKTSWKHQTFSIQAALGCKILMKPQPWLTRRRTSTLEHWKVLNDESFVRWRDKIPAD